MKTLQIRETIGSETITGSVAVAGLTGEREDNALALIQGGVDAAVTYLRGVPNPGEKVPVHVEVWDEFQNAPLPGVTAQIVGNHNDTRVTNDGGWAGEFLIPRDTYHGGPKPISLFLSKDGYDPIQLHTWPAYQGNPPWDGRGHQSGGDPGAYRYRLRPTGVPMPTPRAGVVKTGGRIGRQILDSAGTFNALGITLFWLAWGLEYDRDRALNNLDFAGRNRVHAPRILAVVGYNGGDADPWGDRTINPKVQGFDRWRSMIRVTLEMLRQRKMRTILTVFGGVELLSSVDRQTVCRIIGELVAEYREQILYVEISNEAKVSLQEAIDLARIILAANPGLPLALTAGQHEPGVSTIRPEHLERKITGDGGVWDYTEQGYIFHPYRNAGSDQEPIGDKSSVAADSDPERLTSEGVTSMVCGAPVTVLHVGAGIFGGGKGGFSRGREANLWEVPNIETMLASKANASERLYADVADFGDVSHSDPSREGQFPWKTARFQPYNPGAWFLKIYACKHPDGRLAANFMKVQQDVFLEPFQGQQELTIYPCVGPGSDTVRITAGGEPFRVTRRGGFYIVGRQV